MADHQDGDAASGAADADHPFTRRLRHLFATVHPKGAKPYSDQAVADAIGLSKVYIWQLRTGRRTNPTREHIEALARFFGVAPTYFFDEATQERTDAQLALLAAIRDERVATVAVRAAGLSPAALDAILGMIDHAHAIDAAAPKRGERTDPSA